jgi:hypothetical protein
MSVLRSRLLQPRRQLSVKFNGIDLVPQPQVDVPGGLYIDARNGPQPQSCDLVSLTDTTFLLNWSCVAHYWESPKVSPGSSPVLANQVGNPVLSNRWTETVEFDKYLYSRRVREGRCVIRSDNIFGLIADQARESMAAVAVPPGFLRESSRYTVTPDGLALQYQVVDKEQFKMPPAPAYEAEGEYRETTPRGGACLYLECRVRLKGAKSVPQDSLLTKALSVCVAKVYGRGKAINPAATSRVIEGAGVTQKLYENEVEAFVRLMQSLPTTTTKIKTPGLTWASTLGKVFAVSTGFGSFLIPDSWLAGTDEITIPGSNPLNAFRNLKCTTPFSDALPDPAKNYPKYPVRGTASRLLQAAAYYDPSLTGLQLSQPNDQLDQGAEVGTAVKNPGGV